MNLGQTSFFLENNLGQCCGHTETGECRTGFGIFVQLEKCLGDIMRPLKS